MGLPAQTVEQSEDKQTFQPECVVLAVLPAVPPPDHQAPLEVTLPQPPEQKPAPNLPQNT